MLKFTFTNRIKNLSFVFFLYIWWSILPFSCFSNRACKIIFPVDCCTSSDYVTFFRAVSWGLLFIHPFTSWLKALRKSVGFPFSVTYIFWFFLLHCNVFGFVYSNESISIFNLRCQFLLFFSILLSFDKELKMMPN